jgi:hypothetical protein
MLAKIFCSKMQHLQNREYTYRHLNQAVVYMTIERKEDNLNPDFSKISYAEYS